MTTIENMTIDLNPDELTVGEIEDVEELCPGRSITDFGSDGIPQGRLMRAMLFVVVRRTQPDFTFEQARDLKLGEIVRVSDPEESAAGSTD